MIGRKPPLAVIAEVYPAAVGGSEIEKNRVVGVFVVLLPAVYAGPPALGVRHRSATIATAGCALAWRSR